MKAWMRDLRVRFTSTLYKKSLVFGGNWQSDGGEDLAISVNGSKYLTGVKDTFVIEIANLSQGDLVLLTKGQFFQIEIFAGYRSLGDVPRIFNGSVAFYSLKRNNDRTETLIAICTSQALAKFGQSRMSLNFSANINMYSLLEFTLRKAGLTNIKIDESLKNKLVREVTSITSTPQSWLENFASQYCFSTNTDASIAGNKYTILNTYKNSNRLIKLTNQNIMLSGGYPTITKDGLTLPLFATMNLICGDVIQIDNSIIDMNASSYDEISEKVISNTTYINNEGKYMVYQIDYCLTNRDSSFTMTVHARNREMYTELGRAAAYGE